MPLNHGNCFSSTTNTNHTNINHQKTPGTTFPPRISCLLFFQTLPFLFHLAAFRLPIDIRLCGVEIWKQTKPYTAFADFKRPGLGDDILWNFFLGCLEICRCVSHPAQQLAKNGEKKTARKIRDLGRCTVIKTSL